MKKLISTIMLLIAAFITTGCSEEVTDPAPKVAACSPEAGAPRSLAQVWFYESASVNGSNASLASVLDWAYDVAFAGFLIETGGAYYYAEFDQYGSLLYENEGMVATDGDCFTISIDGQKVGGKWSVSGDRLTLSATVEDDKVVLKALRYDPEESAGQASLGTNWQR